MKGENCNKKNPSIVVEEFATDRISHFEIGKKDLFAYRFAFDRVSRMRELSGQKGALF